MNDKHDMNDGLDSIKHTLFTFFGGALFHPERLFLSGWRDGGGGGGGSSSSSQIRAGMGRGSGRLCLDMSLPLPFDPVLFG